MSNDFANEMKSEFEMCLVGEINKIHRLANIANDEWYFHHTV